MKDNEFIEGILTKTLNMTSEEVAETFYNKTDDDKFELKEDALQLAWDKDSNRVKKIKDEGKEMFDKGYQKANKEVLKRTEDRFAEITGFSSEAEKFEDKIIAYKESVDKVLSEKPKGKEMTDDDIKKHKLYLELETNLQKNYIKKEEHETLTAEFDTFKAGAESEKSFGVVRNEAYKIFKALNPLESENAMVATNRMNDFLTKFKAYDYEIADDGRITILKDGKRLENDQGYPTEFKNFVEQKTKENYDIKANDGEQSAGNKNGTEGVVVPKDRESWNNSYNEEQNPEKRMKLIEIGKQQGFVNEQGMIMSE